MRFDEVLNDVEKLLGKELTSIRPGAEIRLTRVDRKKQQLELRTKKGELKTRPLSELADIWDALQSKPAVHVEKILDGSGSSRNQPETILANLPYIEYLHIGVKHIAYVGESTHELGSLKEMDPVRADAVRQQLRAQGLAVGSIVVTEDLLAASKAFEAATGLLIRPVEMGIYRLEWEAGHVLLVHPSALGGTVPPGTYPVVPGRLAPTGAKVIRVGELTMHVIDSGGVRLAVVC